MQRSGLIIVGSEDYSEKAEGNTDPSWEPGMPGGHLQDERLAELLGELREGDIITTRPGFIVKAAELCDCSGIRIELGLDYALELFPGSAKQMEWIFMSPDRPSFVLMNGVVNKCHGKKSGTGES
jgi:hypothetical protein